MLDTKINVGGTEYVFKDPEPIEIKTGTKAEMKFRKKPLKENKQNGNE